MRGEPDGKDSGLVHRVYGTRDDASFQVIVLGSGGGPREDTATGLLVRAPQSEWRKSSMIAVDAGAHLASIIAILQKYMPHRSTTVAEPGYSQLLSDGPFAGVHFPYISAKANSLFVFRELLHSFLITHPHLDHLAAMAINTPALEFGREAKAIVALPSVIEAIKAHIFNDSIWPNLSDEGHGVGFVTYRRLTDGGNQRLGSGDARGYVSVCDGLATKCLAVTHGKCQRHHGVSHQRGESTGWLPADYSFPSRRMSRMSDEHGYFAAVSQQQNYASAHPALQMPPGPLTPGLGGGTSSVADKDFLHEPVTSSAFFIRNDVTGKELLIFGDIEPDSVSMAPRNHLVWDEAAPKIANGLLRAIFIECSYDDSVRDADLFGHLCPRHLIAELESLAKRVTSYRSRKNEASRRRSLDAASAFNAKLNHSPAHSEILRKRKRSVHGDPATYAAPELFSKPSPAEPHPATGLHYVGVKPSGPLHLKTTRDATVPSEHSPQQRPTTPSKIPRQVQFQASPRTQHPTGYALSEHDATNAPSGSLPPSGMPPSATQAGVLFAAPPVPAEPEMDERLAEPLKGLIVHIIHVKDTMVDGRSPGEVIAQELEDQAAGLNLGCEFDVTDCGESIWV